MGEINSDIKLSNKYWKIESKKTSPSYILEYKRQL